MNHRIILFILSLITFLSYRLFIYNGTKVFAQEIAAASAQIKSATGSAKLKHAVRFDMRPIILSNYLASKNSLLTKYTYQIIKSSDKYQIDYRLFPAISGVESGFCRVYIVATNNCVGWGGGYIPFDSISDQIDNILFSLKTRYIDDGLTTVDLIGRRWAEDPNWSYKVKMYMQEIELSTSNFSS